MKARKSLHNNMSVQAVVIGAGMSGILTAYFLQKKGIKTVVLEANRIASGQTQNTTAKITSQHGLFYKNALKTMGKKKALVYACANENAIRRFEELIEAEKIECKFEKVSSYLYTTQGDSVNKLQKEARAAALLGISAEFVSGNQIVELPFAVSGAVRFDHQAQFHPLEFVKALSEQLVVYENTRVLSVEGHTVYTEHCLIEADYIVFATHYPFVNIPGFYFMRQHQERSYVLALKEQETLSGMYYSIDKNGLSFRSSGNMLLLGGGSHRTGKAISCQNTEYGYTFLKNAVQKYYPDAETAFAWSAQDCMPHDKIPFIGKYSHLRPYWYVASGFKKWGMTFSMIAAEMISTQIYEDAVEKESKKKDMQIAQYASVFSPWRCNIVGGAVEFIKDLGESTMGIVKGVFAGEEKKCPHMGCKMEWNPQENSWDCPCHGSRFSYEGELKDNPAQIDLKSFHNSV